LASPEEQQFSDGANFWHYDVGVPTIPGILKTKRPLVPWEGYQQNPPTDDEHKEWLKQRYYSGGVMILCGLASNRKDRENLYLVGVDIDKKSGIDAFVTRDGKITSLHDIARVTLVEQHEDSPDRAHIFFYSPIKFPVKRPDEVLGIEVKSSWDHGLMRVTPSITENGYPLRIIGTTEPHILNKLEATELLQHINHICIDNGVEYLQKGDDSNNSSFLTPELKKVIQSRNYSFATNNKVRIQSGYRNVTLISVANSILSNHLDKNKTNEEELKDFFFAINYFLCKPEPLPDREVSNIWISALKWMYPRILEEERKGTRKGAKGKEEKQQQQDEIEKLIKELLEKYQFKTLKDSYPKEEIWFYNDQTGNFSSYGEVIIKARLETKFGLEFTNKDVNEFLGHVQRRTYFDRFNFNPNIEWVASADCMLNLKTGQMAPFSHDFLNTTYIPVKYSPKTQCPKIMKFLHDIVEPEDVELILDFMAYCLWRDYKYANWLLCVGYGHNGKSVLLNLIERFLGKQNTSSESLERLLNKQFAIAMLYQKLANIDADVSGDILIKNTGIIKKLTGNDESPGEFKFKTPFKFRNFAKLIFSCNEIPQTTDMTDAFFRRLIIINFTQQFLAERDDPHILDKLCTEEEFSGLLNELLKRLPRIISQGIRPTTNETMRETYEKYIRGSKPVQYFKDKALMRTNNLDDIVSNDVMYDSYLLFCRVNGIAPESEQAFSRTLTDLGFDKKQVRRNKKRDYYWIGVKVVDWKATEDEDQHTFSDLSDEQLEKLKWKS
jgi:putative DNA primase/helicase